MLSDKRGERVAFTLTSGKTVEAEVVAVFEDGVELLIDVDVVHQERLLCPWGTFAVRWLEKKEPAEG